MDAEERRKIRQQWDFAVKVAPHVKMPRIKYNWLQIEEMQRQRARKRFSRDYLLWRAVLVWVLVGVMVYSWLNARS